MSYVVWDVEATIKRSFKRTANPFDPDNFVVMSGWKRKDGAVVGEYFGRNPKPAGWFVKLLEGTMLLVGQNIKFDLLCALCDKEHGEANLKAWMAYVARGGNVWDTQLAEYLLNGMPPEDHMLSMDELAPRYGGNLKVDEVKAMWQAGINTDEIPPNLLTEYLCGRFAEDGTVLEHGDIGNTETIFLGQLDRARAAGQVKSILLNMGSLLCTTEMERNGMAVDVAEGMRQARELEARLAELSLELADYLPKDLPFDFKWTSLYHKSALIYGGTVKYDAKVWYKNEDGSQQYAKKKVPAYYMSTGQMLECSIWDTYADIDPVWEQDHGTPLTYASGKNKGEYKTKLIEVDDTTKPKGAIKPHYYEFPGVTTPKKQWATALTDAKGGVIYGTGADIIAELGNRDIPFLESLSKVTGLTKDLGTYYIVTDPDTGESKGMLTLVQADGIIHHMLNHTSTVTARFSSSNPNLQNLPKEGKSTVKTVFVSRFPGGKIIQSDFTALEVYIQAILTGDQQLIKDLQAGLDMHCVRVSQKENIPYEEAVLRCKGDKDKGIDALKEWSAKRTKAKVFSFQRAYGAGAAKISESAKIPIEEVEALIKAEEARYPGVERYYERITAEIKANSKPTQKFANHPEVPGLMCNFRKSYLRTPDNKLYSYRESASPEFLAKRGTATSFSPTEIKNYVVQGEGGEWAKAAMWLAIRAFYARGNFGGLGLLVNQVHDALYADADASVAEECAALLEACMLAASEFMEWYFDWIVPVPVPSETVMGTNMMAEEPIRGEFPEKVRGFRAAIRAEYIGGYVPSFERVRPALAA